MNKLKKIFRKGVCVLTIFSLIVLAGCGSAGKPETTVVKFCDALKEFDTETASSCFVSDDVDIDPYAEDTAEEQDVFTKQAIEYLKKSSKEMTYTVGESAVDGDKAIVPVTFTYVDASPVLSAAIGDYFTQALGLAFSGADESAMQDLFGTIFMEKAESVSTGTATTVVELECVKNGNEWKIQIPNADVQNEITNIISCNVAKVMESMNENFSGDTIETSEVSEEDLVWFDVPAGRVLELATIKMVITGCEETDKLTAEYMEADVAQEGTKYVVLHAEIENITKSTLDFNNDFLLYDSQGREYLPYDDALWYFDETFTWTQLAPNIKASGVLVYHVPADADGYYLTTGKSGTNEAYRLYAE